jgi:hypothetical protein
MRNGKGRDLRWAGLRKARNGGQLLECGTLVIAAECALGEEIHGYQHAR